MRQAVAALHTPEPRPCDADNNPAWAEKMAEIPASDSGDLIEAEWEASLSLVRQAASTVRAMHQRAHSIALEAHQGVQRSMEAARMAEERAQRAEASAKTASERADQAEVLLGTITARLQAAEQRMHDAEMQAGLAHERLKVMCDRIADEFDTLTVSPSEIRASVTAPPATPKSSRPGIRNVRPVLPIVGRTGQPTARDSTRQAWQIR